MSTAELASSYAALILADEGIPITAEKIDTLVAAAKVEEYQSIWGSLYAKALEGQNVKDLLLNVGSGAAPAATGAAGGAAAGGAAAPAAEEKQEEEEEEESDMDLDLFG